MTPDDWKAVPCEGVLSDARFALRFDPALGRPRGAARSGAYWADAVTTLGAARFGVSSDEVAIAYEPSGKPTLRARGEAIYVSFSATVGARACAISPHVPIGIDIERRAEFPDAMEMLERAAHEQDIESLLAAFGGTAQQAILPCWTAKEAVLKAMGTGLRVDPRRVRLDRLSPEACRASCDGLHFAVHWFDDGGVLGAVAVGI